MRQVCPISKLQPLQMDTVALVPNSYIPGVVGAVTDVVGTGFAAKVIPTDNINVAMNDGNYRVTVVAVGATGVGSYTITDLERGTTTGTILTSATKQSGYIAGVDILVADTVGMAVGAYAEFSVIGDQTYIIPGTILGRVTGTHNWSPASDATINNFDRFTIANSFQETDKTKTVLPNGYENNVSQVYTIDVIVYGQIVDSACRAINMTDNLKAKLTQICWL